VKIDEAIDYAVGIAGDVDQRRCIRRDLVQLVNRDDRKELVDRPVIRHRTEDRKIAEILGREELAQIVELFPT
jgi:hypothetical protein